MSSNIKRKLAAIMFTDISGYTSQMSKDEAIAINLLTRKESVLKPLIKEYNGTYVKSTGDGSLSYFNSAIDAAMCAKKFQESIFDYKDLNVRVGVHLGDTIFEKGDIKGDGVNIASRLESMAIEGGIFISKEVQDQLINQQSFDGVSLGLQKMKGIGRLIEVFALKGEKLKQPNPKDYQKNMITKHSGDEVPSIAIMPFQNKGKDEDMFYAYSISTDLISDVCSAGLIRVASKKDIEKLDYVNLDNHELSKKLFIRYVANGELWRMGNMFQLSVELYDTKSKNVVWSDRWQEKWDNLTIIKEKLSDGILKALDTTPQLKKVKDYTNVKAYELYLKALYNYENRKKAEDLDIAQGLASKAFEIDNNCVAAKILIGNIYNVKGDIDKSMQIYKTALQQSEKLGYKRSIAICLLNIGTIQHHRMENDGALENYKKSFEIFKYSSNKAGMADCLNNIGNIYNAINEHDQALEYFNKTLEIRTEINDKSGIGDSLVNLGISYIQKGEADKAIDYWIKGKKIYEKLGNEYKTAVILGNIGTYYDTISDDNKALEYYCDSLELSEKIGDKKLMPIMLNNIGHIYSSKHIYDKALDYLKKSIEVCQEVSDKETAAHALNNIGLVYYKTGDNDSALHFLNRAFKIYEKISDKLGRNTLINIGSVFRAKCEYEQAEHYFEKSLYIEKGFRSKHYELFLKTKLYLSYKQVKKGYDESEIHRLVKVVEDIDFEMNFDLYELLDDTAYLKIAYIQFQDLLLGMNKELGQKLMSYPLPKSIIKEYKKIFK